MLYTFTQTVFLSVVQEYTPADGGLSEEFDRDTGVQVSAPDLTWSYASFLTAIARRDGSVPPSWGSSAGYIDAIYRSSVSSQASNRSNYT